MHIGLIIGKKLSTGIKGKNLRKILNRPSAEYSFIASKFSIIDQTFVSTDCPNIKKIGKKYHAHIIDRPRHLCKPSSLTEDVLSHALINIKKKYNNIKTISLLMANNPAKNFILKKDLTNCVNLSFFKNYKNRIIDI